MLNDIKLRGKKIKIQCRESGPLRLIWTPAWDRWSACWWVRRCVAVAGEWLGGCGGIWHWLNRTNHWGSCTRLLWISVLRIHDILVWIQIWISGSMPLTNGSGSCYFRHWPSKCQQKTNLKKVFLLITVLFEGTFKSFFKKRSIESHKAVGIKGFLTIFA